MSQRKKHKKKMVQKKNKKEFNNEKIENDIQKEENEKSQVTEENLNFSDWADLKKKNKNLIALLIILSGVAFGSLFVDVVQLLSQRGFSARALEDAQVVEYDGNTWVRYDDPKIIVEFFDADDCEDCVTDEVLVRLRSLIPTLEAHKIDVRTEEGGSYAQQSGIKYIPSFLFDDQIMESDFYQRAAILFRDNGNGRIFFDAPSVGVPIGEYLEVPNNDSGIVLGNGDSKIEIILYDNFTSNESSVTYPIIEKIRTEFKDDLGLVVKLVPDSEQKNSFDVAKAIYCAHAQEKYDAYVKAIYKDHDLVTQSDAIAELLQKYAQDQKIDTEMFDRCINSEDAQQNIDQNMREALQFGISAAPTIFINGGPHVGVISYQGLKDKIDQLLSSADGVN